MGNVFDKAEQKLKQGGNVFDLAEKKMQEVGKPQPSPVEQFQQKVTGPQAEIAGTLLPIALDIGLAAAAPQLAIPHGAGLVTSLLRRGANVGLRAAGGAAGGGMGEYAAQFLKGEELDPQKAMRHAMVGAGSELLAGPLGAAGRLIAKPLLPLASRVTFLGQVVGKQLSSRIMEGTVGRANKFLYDLSPDIVKKQTVDFDDVAVRISSAKDDIGLIYDAYKKPILESGKEGIFYAGNTVEYLTFLKNHYRTKHPDLSDTKLYNRIVQEEFGYVPSGEYGKTVKKILESGESPSASDFLWLVDHVFKERTKLASTFVNVSTQKQTNRKALKTAYSLDMDDVAGTTKGEADKIYADYMDFIELKKIFDKAITESKLGDKHLDPFKMTRSIHMSKNKIAKIDEKRAEIGLEPLWPQMEKEAAYYAEMVPYFKRAKDTLGIRPGMMGTAGSLASAIGGGSGAFAANVGAYKAFGPWGIPLVEGFGAMSSYALMSPKGQQRVRSVARNITRGTMKTGGHLFESMNLSPFKE